jgi:hypothetical protein
MIRGGSSARTASTEHIVGRSVRIPIKPATDSTLKPATCNAPNPATQNAHEPATRNAHEPATRNVLKPASTGPLESATLSPGIAPYVEASFWPEADATGRHRPRTGHSKS